MGSLGEMTPEVPKIVCFLFAHFVVFYGRYLVIGMSIDDLEHTVLLFRNGHVANATEALSRVVKNYYIPSLSK